MKHYELKAIVEYLKRFSRIRSLQRIADNVIKIEFDGKKAIGFDLGRGRSEIFDAARSDTTRSYHAPFDAMLKKRFSGAKIVDVSMPKGDKVIKLDVEQKGAYKAVKSTLLLEFTGRYTNAIILDEEGVVLEALRHIDSDSSYRVVKPGVKLKPLMPYEGPRKAGTLEDVETYLLEIGRKRHQRALEDLKKRHRKALLRKIERLQGELAKLPDKEALREDAERFSGYGAIVLANLNKIAPYAKRLEAFDFEGNRVTIDLPALPNPKRAGEHFYALAKRAAAKAENLHIEEENLKSRIAFYERLLKNLEAAKSEEQISLLFPPKQKQRKRESKAHCEVFHIGDYRILVGRNERENVWVLKNARAQDMWLHLKDRPSSHCIIQSDRRRELPKELLAKAAKICVETSVTQPGDYLVDFTHRRNVKITRGAHVTYVNYDTIKVRKE